MENFRELFESSTFEKRAKEFYDRWNKGELPAKIFKTIKFTPAEKSRIEDRMNADNGNWSNIYKVYYGKI